MSGIGFGELIILFLIGLIVLGPERLPRVANQIGNWLGQARRMTRVMKRQLEDELDLNKPLDILPPSRTQHASRQGFAPPPGIPTTGSTEKDDTWSPAHDAGSPGTGASDELSAAESPAETPSDKDQNGSDQGPTKDSA